MENLNVHNTLNVSLDTAARDLFILSWQLLAVEFSFLRQCVRLTIDHQVQYLNSVIMPDDDDDDEEEQDDDEEDENEQGQDTDGDA